MAISPSLLCLLHQVLSCTKSSYLFPLHIPGGKQKERERTNERTALLLTIAHTALTKQQKNQTGVIHTLLNKQTKKTETLNIKTITEFGSTKKTFLTRYIWSYVPTSGEPSYWMWVSGGTKAHVSAVQTQTAVVSQRCAHIRHQNVPKMLMAGRPHCNNWLPDRAFQLGF
jgi:hypothetical protein